MVLQRIIGMVGMVIEDDFLRRYIIVVLFYLAIPMLKILTSKNNLTRQVM